MPVIVGSPLTASGTLAAGAGTTVDLNFGNVPACDFLIAGFRYRNLANFIIPNVTGISDNAGSTFGGALVTNSPIGSDNATYAYQNFIVSQNIFAGASPYIITFTGSNAVPIEIDAFIIPINGLQPITTDDVELVPGGGPASQAPPFDMNLNSVNVQEALFSGISIATDDGAFPDPTVSDLFETQEFSQFGMGIGFALVAAGVHAVEWTSTSNPSAFSLGGVTYILPAPAGAKKGGLPSLGVGQ